MLFGGYEMSKDTFDVSFKKANYYGLQTIIAVGLLFVNFGFLRKVTGDAHTNTGVTLYFDYTLIVFVNIVILWAIPTIAKSLKLQVGPTGMVQAPGSWHEKKIAWHEVDKISRTSRGFKVQGNGKSIDIAEQFYDNPLTIYQELVDNVDNSVDVPKALSKRLERR
jgi:hypothetical protein